MQPVSRARITTTGEYPMPMPSLEPTVLLGSPQCVLQLPARAEPSRRERAEDGPRREPRERDDR